MKKFVIVSYFIILTIAGLFAANAIMYVQYKDHTYAWTSLKEDVKMDYKEASKVFTVQEDYSYYRRYTVDYKRRYNLFGLPKLQTDTLKMSYVGLPNR